MKIKVQSNYLVFQANLNATNKQLRFFLDGEYVYNLDLKLDNLTPAYPVYVDVTQFLGQEIELTVTPEVPLQYRQTDTVDIPGLYQEPMRPQTAFSVKAGYSNDPNGLIYVDGVYHMFFQFHTNGPEWGTRQSWGHAVSTDLIHWEEKPIALYSEPECKIYSGSAIVDKENVSGLGTPEHPAVLLYYTDANYSRPYFQCVAFSNDGMQTFHKYKTILPPVSRGNRDPEVQYCEELGKYLMLLYLDEGNYTKRYGFFTSSNLLDWEPLQEFVLGDDNECPCMYHMTDDTGVRRWVLMGAKGRYLIGSFASGKFEAVQEVQTISYDTTGYAAQGIKNLPNGRQVRIVNNRWQGFNETWFSQQMSVPQELTLKTMEDGIIRLCVNPVGETTCLYRDTQLQENIALTPEQAFTCPLTDHPYLIRLQGDYADQGVLNLTYFGRTICFDFGENEVRTQESKTRLSLNRGCLDVTLLIDRTGIDLFMDGGAVHMADNKLSCVPDRNLPVLKLESSADYTLAKLELHPLRSIWEKETD